MSVTLRDMEKEVRFMNGSSDISVSNDLGNVVELTDFNDPLGFDMITNMRMNGGSTQPQVSDIGISEVQVSNLDSGTSFSLPEISMPPFQAELKKDEHIFSNNQTSSASIHLDPAPSRLVNNEA
jgi:hypothetical protein